MKQNNYLIIPAYNEEKRISNVLKKAKKYVQNIVVVDDGSKDKTYENAKKEGITVLRHVVNLGKGSALKTGCDYAVANGAKNILVMDADGQHDAAEIPKFLSALKDSDIVFGYRKRTANMPFVLRFGNWFISKTTERLYGIKLEDTQCGFRAFTANVYRKIRWQALDYSMESEMIANAGKHKLKYKQIQIKTLYLDKYKGTTIMDGIKIVFDIISWRFR